MNKLSHQDFLTRAGERASEYDFLEEYDGMDVKFKVTHKECGKTYFVRPSSILNNHKCRYCSQKSRYSQEEYEDAVQKVLGDDYEVVGKYTGGKNRILMLHKSCGRTYSVISGNVLKGVRCSKCAGSHKKTNEDFLEEVRGLVGEEYMFTERYINSKTPIKVTHKRCGTNFKVAPNNFLSKRSRCPKCKVSLGEEKVKEALERLGVYFMREVSVEGIGKRKFDFYLPHENACIEYDGEHHYVPIEFYGGEEYLQAVKESDRLKDKVCRDLGMKMLRIPYWEADDIEIIIDEFLREVRSGGK